MRRLVILIMGLAILTIGTAADRIDLLDGGWMLVDWTPSAGAHQGAFSESALADFRQMKSYRDVTVPEVFKLRLTNMRSQNTAIRALQRLRRILRQGIDYWATDYQGDPVYLEAKSLCETETRYALVHDAALPQDSFPYGQPFTNYPTGMEDLTLVVERGPWLENPPGEGTCLELEGGGDFPLTETTNDFRPLISTDDAYATNLGNYSATSASITLGESLTEEAYSGGIVFKNVSVPSGYAPDPSSPRPVRILSAHVTFTSAATDVDDDVDVEIHGEASDNAASFSGIYDFSNRPWTNARIPWSAIEHWTNNLTYDTPDLASIIEEIIGRENWAPGNSIALFFMNDKSDAGAHRIFDALDGVASGGVAPVLTITWYEPGETFRGQESTCGGVYLANKNNLAQITDAYWQDGAVFSTNLIGVLARPFALFNSPIGANDALYFGVASSAVNNGPFCSLVFDIATPIVYSGNASMIWQYWNGAWVTLDVRDNTGYIGSPFIRTGINSVSWEQPSDWTTTAVNGITGWWVRALAAISLPPGDAITVPTQDNRDIYTVTWGGIDPAETDGDISAMLRLWMEAVASGIDGTSSLTDTSQSNKLIMGLRALDRGEEFSAYINLAGAQNPQGIQVIYYGGYSPILGYEIDDVADPTAATGYRARFLPLTARAFGAGAGIYIQFSSTARAQYRGTFRALLRCKQTNGEPGYFGAMAAVMNDYPYGSGRVSIAVTNTPAYTQQTGIIELLDLGRVTLPMFPLAGDEYVGSMVLGVVLYSEDNTLGTTLELYDIVLIPVDEWACEVTEDAFTYVTSHALGSWYNRLLDLDGIGYPKAPRALIRNLHGTNLPIETWPLIENAWPHVISKRLQRLWMVTACPHIESGNLYGLNGVFEQSVPYTLHKVKAWRGQRYLSMRGEQ